MITRTAHILFLAITIAILSQSAFAYRLWEPEDGLPIRQSDEILFYRSSCESSADNGEYVLVAWSDTRTGDRDIYAQLYDSDGAPQWDDDGQVIARVEGSTQVMPHVLATSDGAWIVSWEDYRNDVDYNYHCGIYIQKVNNDGCILWPEMNPDFSGAEVSYIQDTDEHYPFSVSDGDGGAITLWVTDRGGNADLYAMHMQSDGSPDPEWNQNGNIFADGQADQGDIDAGNFVAVPDGNNGMIAMWRDSRNPTNQNLYMNRINCDGELQWGPSEGVALCLTEGYENLLCAVPDGSNGAFFLWNSFITGNDEMLILQHVDAEGNLDWEDPGVPLFVNEEQLEVESPSMVLVNTEEVIVAWSRMTIGGYSNSDIYMQKISLDPDDQPVFDWEEGGIAQDGLVLCEADGVQRYVKGVPDQEGGAVFAWLDSRDGAFNFGIYSIFSQRVDSDGAFSWNAENGVGVCIEPGYYNALQNHLVADHIFYLWGNSNSGSMEISRQLQSLESGELLLEEEDVFAGISGSARKPSVVFDASEPDFAWFAWSDGRFGQSGRLPFFQKVDIATGTPVFTLNGVNAIPEFPFSNESLLYIIADSVTMVADNEGGVYIGWQDTRMQYNTTIGFQHVLNNGTLAWGDAGVCGETEQFLDILNPRLLLAPGGGIFTAYSRMTDEYYLQVAIQKIDEEGNFLFGDGFGNYLTNDNSFDYFVAGIELFDDGVQNPPVDGTVCVLIRKLTTYGDFDLYATGVSQDGAILWSCPVCTAEASQVRPVFLKVADGILVVWEDHRNGVGNTDIYGQLIYPDGTVAWETDGIPLGAGDDMQVEAAVATNDNETFWVCWGSYGQAGISNLYIQKYDLDGTALLTPASGRQLTNEGQYGNGVPKVEADAEDGVYVVWEKALSHIEIDLYCTQLNADGIPVQGMPEYNGVPLSEAPRQQQNAMVAPDGTNGIIAVWEDYRSTSYEYISNINAQHVVITGINAPEKDVHLPSTWSLDTAYPNPFNPSTQIGFSLDQRMSVSLTVYDVLGRQVVKLVDGVRDAGRHVVTWNGMDTHGRAAASGTYFYRLEGDGKQLVQKMVLVK